MNWSYFADIRRPLVKKVGLDNHCTDDRQSGTDNTNHPLSAVQLVFLAG